MTILSIPELIKADRLDALQTILPRAGYNLTATPIEMKNDGIVFNNGSVLIEIADSVEVDDAPLMHDGYLQTYRLILTVSGDDDQTPVRSVDDRLIRFEMDCKRALKLDYTCGGYAINQYFDSKGKPSEMAMVNGLYARLVYFSVRYYTKLNDPDSQ
jgi:hypothetical protein